MYFAGSVGLTALSAVAVSRTPALMGLMMRGSWLVSFLTPVELVFIYFFGLLHLGAGLFLTALFDWDSDVISHFWVCI